MIIHSEEPYVFDTDENGMVALTEKNARFINAVLSVDSAYKAAETGMEGSTQALFRKYGITVCESELTEQIRALNRENSTHLYAADGFDLTVKKIMSIHNLKDRLKRRDEALVGEIASASPGRNNFSFASKYCTYACRYCLDEPYKDGYCIYDRVLEQTIPYYARYFLKERYISRKKSTLHNLVVKEHNYKAYIDLIDRIIEAAYNENGYGVSHKDFERILWYCYKGDEKTRTALIADKINQT